MPLEGVCNFFMVQGKMLRPCLIRRLILICWLPLIYSQSWGQDPFFRNYGPEEGLPSYQVYQVHQDKKGFLWLATDHGLARYDGVDFKVYTVEDGLCDNTIFGIYEDAKKELWVYSQSGKVSRLSNGEIHNPAINDQLPEIFGGRTCNNMAIDSEGNFWFGVYSTPGLYKVSPEGKAEQFLMDLEHGQSAMVTHQDIVREGLCGLYTEYETPRPADFPLVDTSSIRLIHFDGRNENSTSRTFSIKVIDDRRVAYAAHDEIQIWKDGRLEQTIQLPKPQISEVFLDKRNDLWIGLYQGGVVRIQPDSEGRYHIREHFFGDYSISCILEDAEGSFWFSSLHNGLFCAPNMQSKTYFLDEYRFFSIGGIGNTVFAGTRFGQVLKMGAKESLELPCNVEEEALEITRIKLTSDSILMVGSSRKAVSYDLTTGNCSLYYNKGLRDWIKTSEGIWINSFREVFYLEENQVLFNSRKTGFVDRILAISLKGEKEIYMGGVTGLWSFDGNYPQKVSGHPLLSTVIADLARLPSGELVLGTGNYGLLIKNGDQYQTINQENGLMSNICRDLIVNDSGAIFVASNLGVQEIRLKGDFPYELELIDYSQEDGLCSRQVNRLYVSGQNIWATTGRGVSRLTRKKSNLKRSVPVYLDQFFVNGDALEYDYQIALEPEQHNLDFEFVALTYKSGQPSILKYRLLGLDDKWYDARNRQIRFNKLPPGSYKLQVKLKGPNVVEEVKEYQFVILEPWYEQTLVQVIGGLLLVLILIGIFYYQSSQWAKRNRLTRLSLQSELKALRAQMNPHFLFNALNSIQFLISKKEPEKATLAVADFAVLMRKVLGNSNQTNLTLREEKETLKLYLDMEKLRFGNGLEYEIDIHPGIDLDQQMIPSMLLQPFVENAIWHGLMKKEIPGGKVSIRIDKQNEVLNCQIADDGIGREEAARIKESLPGNHKSSGLEMIRNRIRILNTDRKRPITLRIEDGKDENGKPQGTVINLEIPAL